MYKAAVICVCLKCMNMHEIFMPKNVPINEIFRIFSDLMHLLMSKSLLQSVLLSKDEHGGINNYIHKKKIDNVTFVAPPFKCIYWKCYFNNIASIGSNITRKSQNKIEKMNNVSFYILAYAISYVKHLHKY